ncbi:hypothetical protein F5141DRAFT_1061632 [Pisolithus sp. B1]|nr:hypothetical protein F5141DRAFT_1061632 [Pisolithus sp. B1]
MAVIGQFIPDYDEPVMHQSTTGKAEVSAVSSTHRRRITPLPDPSRLSRLPLASTTSSKFIAGSLKTLRRQVQSGLPRSFVRIGRALTSSLISAISSLLPRDESDCLGVPVKPAQAESALVSILDTLRVLLSHAQYAYPTFYKTLVEYFPRSGVSSAESFMMGFSGVPVTRDYRVSTVDTREPNAASFFAHKIYCFCRREVRWMVTVPIRKRQTMKTEGERPLAGCELSLCTVAPTGGAEGGEGCKPREGKSIPSVGSDEAPLHELGHVGHA